MNAVMPAISRMVLLRAPGRITHRPSVTALELSTRHARRLELTVQEPPGRAGSAGARVHLLQTMLDYDAQPGREPEEPDLSAAQLEADDTDLYAGLRGVSGIVAGAHGVIDLLSGVAEFAAQAIPGVEGAGVALLELREGIPRVQTWAATAVLINEIDKVQYDELNEGPCLTCMQTRRPAVSGSLGSDSRWPRFGGRVARMRVHSALSLPLIVGDEVIGAINAYAKSATRSPNTPCSWGPCSPDPRRFRCTTPNCWPGRKSEPRGCSAPWRAAR